MKKQRKILTKSEYDTIYQTVLSEVLKHGFGVARDREPFGKFKTHWYDLARVRKKFNDIENGEPFIRPQIFTGDKDAVAAHQSLCEEILASYPFDRPVDKVIFSQYANGKTLEEIETHLARHGYKRLKREAIRMVIARTMRGFK